MVALLILLLIDVLWIVLLVALALWALGFLVGGAEAGLSSGRRRWYGRW